VITPSAPARNTALLAAVQAQAPPALQSLAGDTVRVTVDNFNRAETDMNFAGTGVPSKPWSGECRRLTMTLMLQEMLKLGGNANQIVYWSRLPDEEWSCK
jgi:hypothetical protein